MEQQSNAMLCHPYMILTTQLQGAGGHDNNSRKGGLCTAVHAIKTLRQPTRRLQEAGGHAGVPGPRGADAGDLQPGQRRVRPGHHPE